MIIKGIGKNRILEVFEEKQYKNFIITNHIEILPLSEYLTKEEAKNIFNYYQIKYDKELEKYLIYFDHKVPDNISSHPYIFNGLVPNKKNKEIIQQIYEINKQYYDDNDNKLKKLENQYNNTQNIDEKEKIEKELEKVEEEYLYLQNERYKIKIKLEKLLDFFPLLTNCDHIEKTLDFEESVCPIPPYKDDYPQFLDKIKKITEKKQTQKEIVIPPTGTGVLTGTEVSSGIGSIQQPSIQVQINNSIDELSNLIHQYIDIIDIIDIKVQKNNSTKQIKQFKKYFYITKKLIKH